MEHDTEQNSMGGGDGANFSVASQIKIDNENRKKSGVEVLIDSRLVSCQDLMNRCGGYKYGDVSQTLFPDNGLFKIERTEISVQEGEVRPGDISSGSMHFTLESFMKLSERVGQQSHLGYFSDDKIARIVDSFRDRQIAAAVDPIVKDQQQVVAKKNGLYFIINFGYSSKEALIRDYENKINSGSEFDKEVYSDRLKYAKKNNYANDHIRLIVQTSPTATWDLDGKFENILPVVGNDVPRFTSILNTYADFYQTLIGVLYEVEGVAPPSVRINIGESVDVFKKKLLPGLDVEKEKPELIKEKPELIDKKPEFINVKPPIMFQDIAGQEKAIEEAKKFVMGITRADIYKSRGIQPTKGMILFGPPGTGKTLIAQAIANESGAEFIPISIKDIVAKYLGDTEKNMSKYFENANEIAKSGRPVILFIDEMEALTPPRGGETHEAMGRLVTVILNNLDGLESNQNVRFLGATNRPDAIDEAIGRSGRIDRWVEVPLPDKKGREAILELHMNAAINRATKKDLFAGDIDLSAIAKLTEGMNGADLANLINSVLGAKIIAEIEGDSWSPVTTQDLEDIMNKIGFKKPKNERKIGFQ